MESWFAGHPNAAMVFAYLVGIELAVLMAWAIDYTYALVVFDLFCVGAATWVLNVKGWSRWWALLQVVPLLQLSIFWFPNRCDARQCSPEDRGYSSSSRAITREVGYDRGRFFKVLVVLCIVGIVAVGAVVALTDFAPTSVPEPTFTPIAFTGVESKTTAPFYIPTKEWAVDWSFDATNYAPGYYVFNIVICERGTGDIAVFQAVQSPSGSTYCYAGQGEYYLDVGAVGLNAWTITIRPP